MDSGSQGGLVNLNVPYRIHQQVGQVIGSILPFSGNAANTHVDEGLVSGEELGGPFAGDPHHFGQLDQHGACQFKGLEVVHAAFFSVCFIEGVQVLVGSSDGHTSLVLFNYQQGLDGPHGLDGFPEGSGLMSRNPGIDFGDLLKLCLSLGIGFLGCQLSCMLRHSSGINHDTFGGIDDGFVKVDLVDVIRVGIIQLFQMILGFLLNVQHAFLHQDYIVTRVGVSTAVGSMIGTVGNERFSGHFPDTGFPVLVFTHFIDRFALPEGEQFFLHDFLVFFGNVEGILRPCSDGI